MWSGSEGEFEILRCALLWSVNEVTSSHNRPPLHALVKNKRDQPDASWFLLKSGGGNCCTLVLQGQDHLSGYHIEIPGNNVCG